MISGNHGPPDVSQIQAASCGFPPATPPASPLTPSHFHPHPAAEKYFSPPKLSICRWANKHCSAENRDPMKANYLLALLLLFAAMVIAHRNIASSHSRPEAFGVVSSETKDPNLRFKRRSTPSDSGLNSWHSTKAEPSGTKVSEEGDMDSDAKKRLLQALGDWNDIE